MSIPNSFLLHIGSGHGGIGDHDLRRDSAYPHACLWREVACRIGWIGDDLPGIKVHEDQRAIQ